MRRGAMQGLLRLACVAVLGLCCRLPALAAACPAAVPAGLDATPVGGDVVSNGLALGISQVSGKEAVEAILARAEQAWRAGGYDVRRASHAGWQVLSAKGERCLVTLQLTRRNGSFGYLARSKPAPAAPTAPAMGVPLPPDAQVAASVASDDDGRRGVVVSASSALSMEQLARFFMEKLADNRWSATRSHRVTNRKSGVSTVFVTAQRDRRQVEIVIWRERASQIVMTVADAL